MTHTYYASEPVVDNFYFVNIPKCASQTVRAWAAQMATKDADIKNHLGFVSCVSLGADLKAHLHMVVVQDTVIILPSI